MTTERSLNQLLWLRSRIARLRTWSLRRRGLRLARDIDISLSAELLLQFLMPYRWATRLLLDHSLCFVRAGQTAR